MNFFKETKETFSILRNRYQEKQKERKEKSIKNLQQERSRLEERAKLFRTEKRERLRIKRAKASISQGSSFNKKNFNKGINIIKSGIRASLKDLKKMRSASKPNPAFSLKADTSVYGFSKPKEEKPKDKSQKITIKIK